MKFINWLLIAYRRLNLFQLSPTDINLRLHPVSFHFMCNYKLTLSKQEENSFSIIKLIYNIFAMFHLRVYISFSKGFQNNFPLIYQTTSMPFVNLF